jgi:hypothetical protein
MVSRLLRLASGGTKARGRAPDAVAEADLSEVQVRSGHLEAAFERIPSEKERCVEVDE